MRSIGRYSVMILIWILAIGCQESREEEITSEPLFEAIEDNIRSQPGLNLVFQAILSDPAGIQSINLSYQPWSLDETIFLDTLPQRYWLKYPFDVPKEAQIGSTHNIEVTAANRGGITTTTTFTVTLDQDIIAPELEIESPLFETSIQAGDGPEFTLKITFKDNEALALLEIESPLLSRVLPLAGKQGGFTSVLDIPKPGKYLFLITVFDLSGNSTQKQFEIEIQG